MTHSPPEVTGDEVERLQTQVTEATGAAEQAYRDSSRLIRLLAVIGEPAAPDVLIDRALGVLSEVFKADVTCLLFADGEQHVVLAARGFGEDEERVLPALPGAEDLLLRCGLAAWSWDGAGPAPQAAGIPVHSVARVPLASGGSTSGETLVLLRTDPQPFTAGELQMLLSMAARLRASVEEGERRAAIERLARSGHRFTRHLELAPLLDEALDVLRDMTGADAVTAITIEHGIGSLQAQKGTPPSSLPYWPRPVESLIAWPSVLRGESFLCDDLLERPGVVGNPQLDWMRSMLCVPVLRDGQAVALLYAGHARPGFFSRATVDATAVLGGYVGSALVNGRLYSALAANESQLRTLTDELRLRATHDSLTGLANRDLARQLLEASLATEQPEQVGLLFCDLDKFKAINDRLGHEAGDDLLCQVADRLRSCVRNGDMLARLGGDEFLIVLPFVEGLDDVTQIGNRVLAALDEPFLLGGAGGATVRVAASVGGVVGDRGRDGPGAGDLLRDADAAMYEAKNRGRGRVEVFDRFTAQKAVDRLTLREELLTALEQGQLELNYQPIVQLADGRVTGFEALMRWNHPQLGRVPPIDFIPMAEETGAITAIGSWALREACQQLAAWQRELGQPLSMAVNVSPIQLLDPAFAARSVKIIEAAGLRSEHVWLEVTESIEVTDQLIEQLRTLRAAGVRVAMDDFGMSYSNLGYLKHLPVERLKIDREFVAGLGGGGAGNGMDLGIVRAILAIAESAGMSVVAEGIETEEQWQVLVGLGCRQGQGYLFAKPMSQAEATHLLTPRAPAILTGTPA